MIEKIKKYLDAALGVIVLILGALLFSSKRREEKAASDLSKALTKEAIRANEKEREKANEIADDADAHYAELKHKYDIDGKSDN